MAMPGLQGPSGAITPRWLMWCAEHRGPMLRMIEGPTIEEALLDAGLGEPGTVEGDTPIEPNATHPGTFDRGDDWIVPEVMALLFFSEVNVYMKRALDDGEDVQLG